MNNHEEQSPKETLRIEKLKAEEAKILSKDQERTQAYLIKEQEREKGQKIKENQRAEERASQEIKDRAKEIIRKEALLAREKTIAQEQEARTSKNKSS
jgi:hypothetical protein